MLANFTKASLIVPETQAVARLLLEHPDAERWRQAVEAENVLQAKTVNTAKSYANIARMRLETMDEALWEIPALSDEYRRMSPGLEDRIWRSFFADMSLIHANLADVSEGTQTKLRQNAYRILTEAGYLAKNKAKSLQHVRVLPEVRNYLAKHGHNDILAAMDCAH